MLKEVSCEFNATFETKKSKFVAYLCPYNQFDNLLARLQKEHTKARHFVYAYQYLNEFEQIVQNSSDDKEPRGTSGRPCLNVLSGAGVINSAVIVVRYFGGIKLGTGGLVRAYSNAVNQVLSISTFIQYQKLETKILKLEYNFLGQIEYLLNQIDIKIEKRIFKDNILLELASTKEKFHKLINKLPLGVIFTN